MEFSYTEAQKELFDSLNSGDLVWANMPKLTKKELKRIEPKHQVRPYLVVWKDADNIYAYATSSKISKCLCNFEIYGIDRNKYGNTKDTWIELKNIVKLPICNLIDKMYALSISDLAMVEKRLQIQLIRSRGLERSFGVAFNFCEGDVVGNGHDAYYIYRCDSNKIYCYQVNKKIPKTVEHFSVAKIDRKNYYINFDVQFVFDDTIALHILDIASNIDILNIERIKKEYLKIRDREDKCGCLVSSSSNILICLFKDKESYYGVDICSYVASPKLLPIAKDSKIIGICNDASIKEVVYYLYKKIEVRPKAFYKLYKNLKQR